MTKYSHEENVVSTTVTFKMQMQQVLNFFLQKNNSKKFMELK